VSRYRLRFLLQEFDLLGPEVLLGRSGDCQITLEDPLVSRQHARIRIDPEPAIEDLGSRNGVRVNGRRIEGPTALQDGDRIRLGTQELVFSVMQRDARSVRPTGYLRNCRACGTPYPEGVQRCPHCGAHIDKEEDTTMSGFVVEPSRRFTFQLLGEVIERALESGRIAEADRLLERAAKELDALAAAREIVDPNQVEHMSIYAIRIAKLEEEPDWLAWVMELHRALRLMPSSAVIDQLEELELSVEPGNRSVLADFVEHWRQKNHQAPSADLAGLARLERLTR
jgi:hypothetical protein